VTVLPPKGIRCRASTDTLRLDDAEVAEAVQFIRDNVGRPIRLDDVCEAVALSRRNLQRRFRPVRGRTVEQEIRHARIERAKRLLRETSLTIRQVAARCGFNYLSHFGRVFREFTGTTPAAYRRQFERP
jgi:LacI family transcriptional regulator